MFIFAFIIIGGTLMFLLFYIISKANKRKLSKEKWKKLYTMPMPWHVCFLTVLFYAFPLILIIAFVMITPVYLYIHFYGPLGGAYKTEIGIVGWIIWAILFYYLVIRSPKWKWLKKVEKYPIKRWILKNTHCPSCNNLFEKCESLSSGKPLFDNLPAFRCYCKHCKKNISIPSKDIKLEQKI